MRVFVRCLIEQKDGHWQGFSLEYGLAVQGTSETDVRRRLERVMLSYIYDALVGLDRAHASELLARRATAKIYIRYYYEVWRSWLSTGRKSARSQETVSPYDYHDDVTPGAIAALREKAKEIMSDRTWTTIDGYVGKVYWT